MLGVRQRPFQGLDVASIGLAKDLLHRRLHCGLDLGRLGVGVGDDQARAADRNRLPGLLADLAGSLVVEQTAGAGALEVGAALADSVISSSAACFDR